MSTRRITPLRERTQTLRRNVKEPSDSSHESLVNSFGSVMNEKMRLIPITERFPITKIEKKTLFIIDSICEILEKNYPFSNIKYIDDDNKSYNRMIELFKNKFPLNKIIEKYAKYLKRKITIIIDENATQSPENALQTAKDAVQSQHTIQGEILYSYFLYLYFGLCKEIIEEHINIYDNLLSKYNETFINNPKIEEYNRFRLSDRTPGDGTIYDGNISRLEDRIDTYRRDLNKMKDKMHLFKYGTFEIITQKKIDKIEGLFQKDTAEIIKLDYMTILLKDEYDFLHSVSKPFQIVLELGKNRIYKKDFGPNKKYNLNRMVEEKIRKKESASGRGTKKNRRQGTKIYKVQKSRKENRKIKNK